MMSSEVCVQIYRMTINPRESNSIIQRRIRDDDLDQNQAVTESEMGGDLRYDDKRALDLGQEQNLSTNTQLPVMYWFTVKWRNRPLD